jgi:hypothetical protein
MMSALGGMGLGGMAPQAAAPTAVPAARTRPYLLSLSVCV